MVYVLTVASIATILISCQAFVIPSQHASSFGVSSQGTVSSLNANKLPFFAAFSEEKKKEEPIYDDDEESDPLTSDFDREVNQLVDAELEKNKRIAKLKNANGFDYAPWMQVTEGDEKEIRQMIIEKKRVRMARKEQEKTVSGSLYLDSQAQELSGTGLNAKNINGAVELQWGTKSENDSKGFIVRRRAVKTADYEVIASYETYGPLASKGADGGIYSYLDDTATPGGWMYRISERSIAGDESDLCQCLVEVQTEDEQKAVLIGTVGIALFFVIAVVAGISLDPMQ
jgi:hypothetical protein